MRKQFIGLLIMAIVLFGLILYSFTRPWFTYGEGAYRVEMDSVIRHLWVRCPDVVAKFGVFACEEDHQLNWKEESPVRYSVSGNTLFTFSSLYTYDVYKTWIFQPQSFSVEITKAYMQDGFSDNNQIVVDIYNHGFNYTDNSITFFVDAGSITITVLSASPQLTIQLPRQGYPSEAQFNFNNASDRTTSFHHGGDLERALFNVSIQA